MVTHAFLHIVFVAILAATSRWVWLDRSLIPSLFPLVLAAAAVEPALVNWWNIGALAALIAADRAKKTQQFATALFAIAVLWICSGVVFTAANVSGFDPRMQAIAMIVGSLLAASSLPREALRLCRDRWLLAALFAVLMSLAPFLPGLGAGEGGQLRMTFLGLTFQPGEMALVLGVTAAAGYFAKGHASAVRARYGATVFGVQTPAIVDLIPIMVAWAGLLFLVAVIGDLGTAAIAWAAVTAAVAGTVGTDWAAATIPIGITSSIAVSPLLSPVAGERWRMWLSPWTEDPQERTSHLARSLTVSIDGGLLGSGSRAAGLGIVPQVARDGAFAGAIGTLGLVGGISIVVVLCAWGRSWLQAVLSTQDEAARGVRSGILAYLGCLATLSVLGPIGITPWTGVPVPILARAGTVAVVLIALSSELNADGQGPALVAVGTPPLSDRIPSAIGLLVVASVVSNSIVGSPSTFDLERDRSLLSELSPAKLVDRNGESTHFAGGESVPAIFASSVGERQTFLGVAWMVPGETTHLTVDNHLHKSLAATFDKSDLPYAVVALETHSGDILAATASPGMDALATELAPGSTYKLVVAAAMIEDEEIDADRWVNAFDNGYSIGELALAGACGGSLVTALAVSCNAPFAAYDATYPKRVSGVASRFGFTPDRAAGNRSPIVDGSDLPLNASVGVHPTDQHLGEFELALIGIGQHDALATPLGVAVVTATIFNGGWMTQPGLLPRKRHTKQILKSSTATELASGMEKALREGTGKSVQVSPELIVKGLKTGTAEAPGQENRAWCTLSVGGKEPLVISAVVKGNIAGTAVCQLIVDGIGTSRSPR